MNQVLKYLEQTGKLTEVMRFLETTEDKVAMLELDERLRPECDDFEKKRILLKLKAYFENGESFGGIPERIQF
jgi:hypothetical protein